MTAADTLPESERVCVVGLGLIGGSIVRALRSKGFRGTIDAVVADDDEARQARELGLVDEPFTDISQAVAKATLVVVAVPLGSMTGVFAGMAGALSADAVVTDTGSTKLSVIREAQACFGDRIGRFVPGHPISGTERSGLDAGFAELFERRRVILTPTPETDRDALARVEALWRAVGAQVSEMDGAHHDEVLAATSHLPHLLAYTLVDTLARMAERTEIFEYAAGGFADFTRIASSSPSLWGDIVTANHDAILPVLDRYIGDLEAVRSAIADGDRDRLTTTFTRAKMARDGFAAGKT
ncbi:bifunctional cyclohexadienyl dehydrogenase/ 3-phosphoshikimate 1-carboxyvinyltransferase [Salinisphaera shabanensis T35B1]|uniref:prephenate dehydrogenase n=1 Tax=Salinisphaera shabanensis TaxID=180542 RepID=UPI00333EDBFF